MSLSQEQLDKQMIDNGSGRYVRNIDKMKQRETESITPYGMRLADHWIEPVAKGFGQWRKIVETQRYNETKDDIANVLKECGVSNREFALIAISIIMDYSSRAPTFSFMVSKIGSRAEDEHRYNYFRKAAPDLYKKVMRQLERGQQIYRRSREIIKLTMKRAEEKGNYVHNQRETPPFPAWPLATKLKVGGALLAAVQVNTDLISVTKLKRGRFWTKVITLSRSTIEWINKYNDWFKINKPMWLPMVEEPMDWTNPYGGGYKNQEINCLTLVKSHNKDYIRSLIGVEMPDTYAAVNALQKTAWRINRPVLEVAKHVWNQGQGGSAGLPSRLEPVDYYIPPKPHDIDTNDEVRKSWRHQAAKAHNWYRKEKGKNIQTAYTLNLAKQFRNEKEIYFPYQLDFRGRTYTVPMFLTPQGADLSRGLLQFAKGKRIDNQSAADWLAIAGANLYGMDKLSYEDRVGWVHAHRKEIEATVDKPLDNKWWQDADGGESAFQFLAWAHDWVGYLKQGYEYVSHFPINLDASNNGLQILSLLARDEVAGFSTNCLPTEAPEDIYGDVAQIVIQTLEKDAKGGDYMEEAKFWLDYGISRKTCKRPTMTFSYGSTHQSCMQYVKEWFDDQEVLRAKTGQAANLPEQTHFMYSVYLGKTVWRSLGKLVDRPKKVMEWFMEVAKRFSAQNRPITWTVPTGMPVLQEYWNLKSHTVTLAVSKLRVNISGTEVTKKVDNRKAKNGISANFVHSLDAALLHMVVARAKCYGIESFSMIHDSYGVLPADTDIMVALVRNTFHEVFTQDILQEAKKAWEKELGEELPPVPEYGNMDVSKLLESEYLFS